MTGDESMCPFRYFNDVLPYLQYDLSFRTEFVMMIVVFQFESIFVHGFTFIMYGHNRDKL